MLKLKMVTVEIEAPRWVKRLVSTTLAGVMAFGVSAVVRADVNVKTDFMDGQELTAQQLNDNFGALKVHVEALEAKQVVIGTSGTAHPYSVGATQFCGTTTGMYDGATMGGYAGAKAKCEGVGGKCSVSAHMCTADELIRTAQVGGPPGPFSAWFSSGAASLVAVLNQPMTWQSYDCSGWTSSNASDSGNLGGWDASGAFRPSFAVCNESKPVACCDD